MLVDSVSQLPLTSFDMPRGPSQRLCHCIAILRLDHFVWNHSRLRSLADNGVSGPFNLGRWLSSLSQCGSLDLEA